MIGSITNASRKDGLAAAAAANDATAWAVHERGVMRWILRTLAVVLVLTLGATAQAASDPRDSIVDAYLIAQAALAADKTEAVAKAAGSIERAAADLGKADAGLRDRLRAEARALAAAKDIGAAREAFKPLSADVIALARGHYRGKRPLAVFTCSMAKASWIQEDGAIRNPYYGSSMLECGERTGPL